MEEEIVCRICNLPIELMLLGTICIIMLPVMIVILITHFIYGPIKINMPLYMLNKIIESMKEQAENDNKNP